MSECDVEGAECVSNYCGGCNAVWIVGEREVCQEGMFPHFQLYCHSSQISSMHGIPFSRKLLWVKTFANR